MNAMKNYSGFRLEKPGVKQYGGLVRYDLPKDVSVWHVVVYVIRFALAVNIVTLRILTADPLMLIRGKASIINTPPTPFTWGYIAVKVGRGKTKREEGREG